METDKSVSHNDVVMLMRDEHKDRHSLAGGGVNPARGEPGDGPSLYSGGGWGGVDDQSPRHDGVMPVRDEHGDRHSLAGPVVE